MKYRYRYRKANNEKGGGNNGEMEEGTWGRTITLINAMESNTMGEAAMIQETSQKHRNQERDKLKISSFQLKVPLTQQIHD